MRKGISFIALIFLISPIIMGCKQNEEIHINEVKSSFWVYDLVPNSLDNEERYENFTTLAINKNRQESYYRLHIAYSYINNLFYTLNTRIDDIIGDDLIEVGKEYKGVDYRYIITKNEKRTHLYLEDFRGDQIINVTKEYKDEDLYYYGTHSIENTVFEFEIKNNDDLIIRYQNQFEHDVAYARLVRDNSGRLISHITYKNDQYHYQIISVACGVIGAIYYEYKDDDEDHRYFDVYNENGELIYQSLYLLEENFKLTGWYMSAFEKPFVITNEAERYIVNGEMFYYVEGDVNLHEVKLNYYNHRLGLVKGEFLILGKMQYEENFSQILPTRNPFYTNYEDFVVDYASRIYQYYLKNQ